MKEKSKTVFYAIGCALLSILLVFAFSWFHKKGKAEGMSEGLSKGQSLQVEIQSIKDVGMLEVLTTDVSLYLEDIYGKEDGTPLSATLYKKEGVAVYSIDLSELVIVKDETQMTMFVSIPESAITVELFVDETSTSLEASFIAHSWTGNAEEGYSMAMNLSKTAYEEMKESLQNYDGLLLMAVDSGTKQIERLAKAAIKDAKKWDVEVFLKKDVADE